MGVVIEICNKYPGVHLETRRLMYTVLISHRTVGGIHVKSEIYDYHDSLTHLGKISM
jgi:hypothetical protein